MKWTSKHALGLVFVGCMSVALGACMTASPDDLDEGEGDEPELSTQGAHCNGFGNWCLVKCSKSGDTLHVVGRWNQLNGVCATPGEAYCKANKLGYRTQACWGAVTDD